MLNSSPRSGLTSDNCNPVLESHRQEQLENFSVGEYYAPIVREKQRQSSAKEQLSSCNEPMSCEAAIVSGAAPIRVSHMYDAVNALKAAHSIIEGEIGLAQATKTTVIDSPAFKEGIKDSISGEFEAENALNENKFYLHKVKCNNDYLVNEGPFGKAEATSSESESSREDDIKELVTEKGDLPKELGAAEDEKEVKEPALIPPLKSKMLQMQRMEFKRIYRNGLGEILDKNYAVDGDIIGECAGFQEKPFQTFENTKQSMQFERAGPTSKFRFMSREGKSLRANEEFFRSKYCNLEEYGEQNSKLRPLGITKGLPLSITLSSRDCVADAADVFTSVLKQQVTPLDPLVQSLSESKNTCQVLKTAEDLLKRAENRANSKAYFDSSIGNSCFAFPAWPHSIDPRLPISFYSWFPFDFQFFFDTKKFSTLNVKKLKDFNTDVARPAPRVIPRFVRALQIPDTLKNDERDMPLFGGMVTPHRQRLHLRIFASILPRLVSLAARFPPADFGEGEETGNDFVEKEGPRAPVTSRDWELLLLTLLAFTRRRGGSTYLESQANNACSNTAFDILFALLVPMTSFPQPGESSNGRGKSFAFKHITGVNSCYPDVVCALKRVLQEVFAIDLQHGFSPTNMDYLYSDEGESFYEKQEKNSLQCVPHCVFNGVYATKNTLSLIDSSHPFCYTTSSPAEYFLGFNVSPAPRSCLIPLQNPQLLYSRPWRRCRKVSTVDFPEPRRGDDMDNLSEDAYIVPFVDVSYMFPSWRPSHGCTPTEPSLSQIEECFHLIDVEHLGKSALFNLGNTIGTGNDKESTKSVDAHVSKKAEERKLWILEIINNLLMCTDVLRPEVAREAVAHHFFYSLDAVNTFAKMFESTLSDDGPNVRKDEENKHPIQVIPEPYPISAAQSPFNTALLSIQTGGLTEAEFLVLQKWFDHISPLSDTSQSSSQNIAFQRTLRYLVLEKDVGTALQNLLDMPLLCYEQCTKGENSSLQPSSIFVGKGFLGSHYISSKTIDQFYRYCNSLRIVEDSASTSSAGQRHGEVGLSVSASGNTDTNSRPLSGKSRKVKFENTLLPSKTVRFQNCDEIDSKILDAVASHVFHTRARLSRSGSEMGEKKIRSSESANRSTCTFLQFLLFFFPQCPIKYIIRRCLGMIVPDIKLVVQKMYKNSGSHATSNSDEKINKNLVSSTAEEAAEESIATDGDLCRNRTSLISQRFLAYSLLSSTRRPDVFSPVDTVPDDYVQTLDNSIPLGTPVPFNPIYTSASDCDVKLEILNTPERTAEALIIYNMHLRNEHERSIIEREVSVMRRWIEYEKTPVSERENPPEGSRLFFLLAYARFEMFKTARRRELHRKALKEEYEREIEAEASAAAEGGGSKMNLPHPPPPLTAIDDFALEKCPPCDLSDEEILSAVVTENRVALNAISRDGKFDLNVLENTFGNRTGQVSRATSATSRAMSLLSSPATESETVVLDDHPISAIVQHIDRHFSLRWSEVKPAENSFLTTESFKGASKAGGKQKGKQLGVSHLLINAVDTKTLSPATEHGYHLQRPLASLPPFWGLIPCEEEEPPDEDKSAALTQNTDTVSVTISASAGDNLANSNTEGSSIHIPHCDNKNKSEVDQPLAPPTSLPLPPTRLVIPRITQLEDLLDIFLPLPTFSDGRAAEEATCVFLAAGANSYKELYIEGEAVERTKDNVADNVNELSEKSERYSAARLGNVFSELLIELKDERNRVLQHFLPSLRRELFSQVDLRKFYEHQFFSNENDPLINFLVQQQALLLEGVKSIIPDLFTIVDEHSFFTPNPYMEVDERLRRLQRTDWGKRGYYSLTTNDSCEQSCDPSQNVNPAVNSNCSLAGCNENLSDNCSLHLRDAIPSTLLGLYKPEKRHAPITRIEDSPLCKDGSLVTKINNNKNTQGEDINNLSRSVGVVSLTLPLAETLVLWWGQLLDYSYVNECSALSKDGSYHTDNDEASELSGMRRMSMYDLLRIGEFQSRVRNTNTRATLYCGDWKINILKLLRFTETLRVNGCVMSCNSSEASQLSGSAALHRNATLKRTDIKERFQEELNILFDLAPTCSGTNSLNVKEYEGIKCSSKEGFAIDVEESSESFISSFSKEIKSIDEILATIPVKSIFFSIEDIITFLFCTDGDEGEGLQDSSGLSSTVNNKTVSVSSVNPLCTTYSSDILPPLSCASVNTDNLCQAGEYRKISSLPEFSHSQGNSNRDGSEEEILVISSIKRQFTEAVTANASSDSVQNEYNEKVKSGKNIPLRFPHGIIFTALNILDYEYCNSSCSSHFTPLQITQNVKRSDNIHPLFSVFSLFRRISRRSAMTLIELALKRVVRANCNCSILSKQRYLGNDKDVNDENTELNKDGAEETFIDSNSCLISYFSNSVFDVNEQFFKELKDYLAPQSQETGGTCLPLTIDSHLPVEIPKKIVLGEGNEEQHMPQSVVAYIVSASVCENPLGDYYTAIPFSMLEGKSESSHDSEQNNRDKVDIKKRGRRTINSFYDIDQNRNPLVAINNAALKHYRIHETRRWLLELTIHKHIQRLLVLLLSMKRQLVHYHYEVLFKRDSLEYGPFLAVPPLSCSHISSYFSDRTEEEKLQVLNPFVIPTSLHPLTKEQEVSLFSSNVLHIAGLCFNRATLDLSQLFCIPAELPPSLVDRPEGSGQKLSAAKAFIGAKVDGRREAPNAIFSSEIGVYEDGGSACVNTCGRRLKLIILLEALDAAGIDPHIFIQDEVIFCAICDMVKNHRGGSGCGFLSMYNKKEAKPHFSKEQSSKPIENELAFLNRTHTATTLATGTPLEIQKEREVQLLSSNLQEGGINDSAAVDELSGEVSKAAAVATPGVANEGQNNAEDGILTEVSIPRESKDDSVQGAITVDDQEEILSSPLVVDGNAVEIPTAPVLEPAMQQPSVPEEFTAPTTPCAALLNPDVFQASVQSYPPSPLNLYKTTETEPGTVSKALQQEPPRSEVQSCPEESKSQSPSSLSEETGRNAFTNDYINPYSRSAMATRLFTETATEDNVDCSRLWFGAAAMYGGALSVPFPFSIYAGTTRRPTRVLRDIAFIQYPRVRRTNCFFDPISAELRIDNLTNVVSYTPEWSRMLQHGRGAPGTNVRNRKPGAPRGRHPGGIQKVSGHAVQVASNAISLLDPVVRSIIGVDTILDAFGYHFNTENGTDQNDREAQLNERGETSHVSLYDTFIRDKYNIIINDSDKLPCAGNYNLSKSAKAARNMIGVYREMLDITGERARARNKRRIEMLRMMMLTPALQIAEWQLASRASKAAVSVPRTYESVFCNALDSNIITVVTNIPACSFLCYRFEFLGANAGTGHAINTIVVGSTDARRFAALAAAQDQDTSGVKGKDCGGAFFRGAVSSFEYFGWPERWDSYSVLHSAEQPWRNTKKQIYACDKNVCLNKDADKSISDNESKSNDVCLKCRGGLCNAICYYSKIGHIKEGIISSKIAELSLGCGGVNIVCIYCLENSINLEEIKQAADRDCTEYGDNKNEVLKNSESDDTVVLCIDLVFPPPLIRAAAGVSVWISQ